MWGLATVDVEGLYLDEPIDLCTTQLEFQEQQKRRTRLICLVVCAQCCTWTSRLSFSLSFSLSLSLTRSLSRSLSFSLTQGWTRRIVWWLGRESCQTVDCCARMVCERIFVGLMTSDRKLKASREGTK